MQPDGKTLTSKVATGKVVLWDIGNKTPKLTINAVKRGIDKHGSPQYELTDGMVWKKFERAIYVDGYVSHARVRNSKELR